MNFSNFKPVQTSNTRENVHFTKGQSFKFKFKKFISKKNDKTAEETIFTISDEYFDKFGLNEKALIELVSPEGVSYLAVVDSDNGTMLRNRKNLKEGNEKGKKFKSTIFEKALSEQGVIDLEKVGVTQKLDLVLVEGSENAVVGEGDKAIQTYGIYEIVKAEGALTAEEEADDAKENGTVSTDAPAPVVEAPASEAPVAQETAPAPQGTALTEGTAPAVADTDDF